MSRIILLATLAMLTGCGTMATFDSGRSSINSGMIDFAAIGGDRDMHTQIHGNPFAIPDDEFDQRVTAVLNARNSRADSNFTTTPGPSARAAFRLVLAFNPVERSLASRLCKDPGGLALAPASQRPINLHIAFCHGDKDITSRRGTLPDATSTEDPAFQNFIAQALQLSQPRRNQLRPLG